MVYLKCLYSIIVEANGPYLSTSLIYYYLLTGIARVLSAMNPKPFLVITNFGYQCDRNNALLIRCYVASISNKLVNLGRWKVAGKGQIRMVDAYNIDAIEKKCCVYGSMIT